jgi:phosphoglycolate phosphatase
MSVLRARRFDLVVFDWDGTLVDSTGAIATCLQHACADLGLDIPDERSARHVIGLGLADALSMVAPALPPERYPELSRAYRAHFLRIDAEIPLFAGARELLEDLRRAGYVLAVATGKSRRGLDRALRQHELAAVFACTRCADEGNPKPHPDMLLHLMETIGTAPERTLMVGDTTHDLELARNAGARAIAMACGAHSAEDLRAIAADAPIVDSIGELRNWFERSG